MQKRFISIWFRYLKTDWFTRRRPSLRDKPFVLAAPDHGRMIVTSANLLAQKQGIDTGMSVADARALIPALEVLDDSTEITNRLLTGLAEWCSRYTPSVAADPPNGLLLDVTGCAHLWGGEMEYITDMSNRIKYFGYDIRAAMADTIGAAWAVARFGKNITVIESGQQSQALLSLPPAALRLEAAAIERLEKLGLRQISQFINMPRSALRRRFGYSLLQRLDQALGHEEELIIPINPIEAYHERLPCLEPIVTATGIEIALQRLLDAVCQRLQKEQKGLRSASFKGYRMDGKIQEIGIGTNRASCNSKHLFKLFETRIETIEPALGIELFTLDALKVEELPAMQENLWENTMSLDNIDLCELLDRIGGKIGAANIQRYIPAAHYWPERSFDNASSINEILPATWKSGRPRPLQLFPRPEPIEVTAPIPDYPPMLFRYKGKLHKIIKADGPERIEAEWWLQDGQHRDYYCVEDEDGYRYWLFRAGHYDEAKSYQWFIHGFFA
jgi:protein ImuB